MRDNYRRVLELMMPLPIVLLGIKDCFESLELRKTWSKIDKIWLIPSAVLCIAWLLSKPVLTADGCILIAQIILFGGLGQELYYRGFIQPRAEIIFGGGWGLMCASILFATYHPISKIVLYGFEVEGLGFLVLFGLVAGFSFRRSRNIVPLALFHSLYDIFRMMH